MASSLGLGFPGFNCRGSHQRKKKKKDRLGVSFCSGLFDDFRFMLSSIWGSQGEMPRERKSWRLIQLKSGVGTPAFPSDPQLLEWPQASHLHLHSLRL